MQELVGKNLNNIVGNLWQRQETETGSGSSHGNIVSIFYFLSSSFFFPPVILFCVDFIFGVILGASSGGNEF